MDKHRNMRQRQDLRILRSKSLECKERLVSLIDHAKMDKWVNDEMEKGLKELKGVCLDGKQNKEEMERFLVTFEINKDTKMASFCARLEEMEAVIASVSKREKKTNSDREEVMVEFRGKPNIIKKLYELKNENIAKIIVRKLLSEENQVEVPRCLEDLDDCSHLICMYEPSLDQQHPGYTDSVYRERREKIASLALTYKSGGVIASVEYTEEEVKTWTHVYEKLSTLYKTHACRQHLEALQLLEKNGVYSSTHIPQLEDVSRFLKNKTGFRLKPVGGLVSARDFLASLAFRVFQSTQYVRHPSRPEYSIEPDCIHELLGHVPMLADPEFAQFSQQIGIASLGASDQEIKNLSTLYWFTVEYGLCREEESLKAYGAGLLTSFGELQYALTDKPKKVPFDVSEVSVQTYDDQKFQEVYFVAESFEDMKKKVCDYTRKLNKAASFRFEPYTNTLQDLSQLSTLQRLARDISEDLHLLASALQKLQ